MPAGTGRVDLIRGAIILYSAAEQQRWERRGYSLVT